jgi:hypothetical protein
VHTMGIVDLRIHTGILPISANFHPWNEHFPVPHSTPCKAASPWVWATSVRASRSADLPVDEVARRKPGATMVVAHTPDRP